MSAAEAWVLAVDAAETPVEDRARFQAEAMLEFHTGWALLATKSAPRGGRAGKRVLGEDEVLHQVCDALVAARRRGVDARLARLFEVAIATGRKARLSRSLGFR